MTAHWPEKVAAIVETELGHFGLLAGEQQGLPECLRCGVFVTTLRRWEQPLSIRWPTLLHRLQMSLELGIKVNHSGLVIFRKAVGTDRELPILPVYVTPFQSKRFGHPRPAVGHEPHVICKLLRIFQRLPGFILLGQPTLEIHRLERRAAHPINLVCAYE